MTSTEKNARAIISTHTGHGVTRVASGLVAR